ncbi:DUF6115 domain-containing protein [Salibacterium halotolerans]|uniref:Swarming motility protein SwrB n=1 Tax=Salibacterium halotolerans TaxID=1884432 RepID=A0A1I5MFD4_9BACI|nr:hypothetical protein [Salibacterium halotolerans]SFP08338.1 hypothetical protein SAMN05518683_102218 [Salibacterium halotolerans]
MTIVVLVFSVALHALTFLVLARFYSHVQSVKEERRQLHGMREEMEEILRQYTEEIKQENQGLKDSLHSAAGRHAESSLDQEEIGGAKKTAAPSFQTPQKTREETVEQEAARETEERYVPPSAADEDQLEASNQAKVLSLSARGYERDQIARELGIGKGEVDLFLKFYQ